MKIVNLAAIAFVVLSIFVAAARADEPGSHSAPRLDDEGALKELLNRLKERMPKDWAVAPIERGKLNLWYWNPPEGNGIRISLRPRNAPEHNDEKAGKPGGLIIWLMDATYTARQPSPSDDQQTLPPQELTKWRNRRVIVWGAVESDWPRWKSDLLAALTTSDSPSTRAEVSQASELTRAMVSLAIAPGKGSQFTFGTVAEAIFTIKNLSDKAMNVGWIVPITNRAEETIALSSSVYGGIHKADNADRYLHNEMQQQATGMALHVGFLLPGQEVAVRTTYRPLFSSEQFRIQYVEAAQKYDGTAGSLLPLKPYLPTNLPDPQGTESVYEPFDAQRWLTICKANPTASTPGPDTPQRAVLLPGIGEGARLELQPEQVIEVKIPLALEGKAFSGEKALAAAAKITGAPSDDLRIAYSVALGGYTVTHGAKCWLLTALDQIKPGVPLPPVPPELLKYADLAPNIRVQISDKQEGFGSGVRPTGRKFWDRYPIQYGDGMYTRGEFIRIDKGNLLEFLRAVHARNGRFGVFAYYFRSRYFTLSIPQVAGPTPKLSQADTPEALTGRLADAIDARDRKAMLVCFGADPDGRQINSDSVWVFQTLAALRLWDAIQARFRREATEATLKDSWLAAADTKHLRATRWTVEGNLARPIADDGISDGMFRISGVIMGMTKNQQGWHMEVSIPANHAEEVRQIEKSQHRTKQAERLAEEVASGKYKTADEVGVALRSVQHSTGNDARYTDAINSKPPQDFATPWSKPTIHGLQARLVLLVAQPTVGAPIPVQLELRHKDGKDWAQNAMGGRYEGAIVVTGGDGKELARHVHAIDFNTAIPGGKPIILCRFDLRDKPYSLDKPGKYAVQFAGFQAGDLATKGMVDLPPTPKLEFEIVSPEAAKPAFPQSKVESRLGLATKALELEKQGQYRAALDLLGQLADADFVIPCHREICDILPDGRRLAEWVGPFHIGNRRLAMMRCHLQLGNPREAVVLAWQTLDAETADTSPAFACIAQHPDLQGGFDQMETRLRDLLQKNPKHRGAEQCLEYVRVERDLADGKFPPLVARIRSGAWDRSSERGPGAELKEYVAVALARHSKEALPDLVKALAQNDQSTWIVYCLGRSGNDGAIEPLFNYLLSMKNYYARQETVLALSHFSDKAASYAIARLDSEKPVVRESAAEVLSACSGDALQKADPGLKHILQALRESRNQGKDGPVNIPTFLLRAIASTRNRDYIGDIHRIRKEAGSFGTGGDPQCIYTLGYLGDTSVVPELIDGLGGPYSHLARPALEAATGKSFPTQKEWQEWWSVESAKKAAAAPALKAIRIDGGYGHLRSMTLTANGKMVWSGWEPPRKAASVYNHQMSDEEVAEIWRLTSQIGMDELQDAYAGGDHAYTVAFIFAEHTKTVKVTSSKKDDRPAAFSQLMERLWKTRDKK